MGKNEIVVVEHERGAIQLSTNLVREYICPAATDKEIFVFLELCKAQRLNPWLREAYLVKYGTNPATIITGKETFTKRAQKNPLCDGWQVTSKGTPPDMTAMAEVYLKNYRMPISVTVDYSEYVALKGDGKPNKMWSEKPKTMLKKVALVQALREAFPEDLGGLYDQTEINTIQAELPTDVIEVVEETTGEIKEVKKSATVKAKVHEPEIVTGEGGEILESVDRTPVEAEIAHMQTIDNFAHFKNYWEKLKKSDTWQTFTNDERKMLEAAKDDHKEMLDKKKGAE